MKEERLVQVDKFSIGNCKDFKVKDLCKIDYKSCNSFQKEVIDYVFDNTSFEDQFQTGIHYEGKYDAEDYLCKIELYIERIDNIGYCITKEGICTTFDSAINPDYWWEPEYTSYSILNSYEEERVSQAEYVLKSSWENYRKAILCKDIKGFFLYYIDDNFSPSARYIFPISLEKAKSIQKTFENTPHSRILIEAIDWNEADIDSYVLDQRVSQNAMLSFNDL